jgi:hypothetical protein
METHTALQEQSHRTHKPRTNSHSFNGSYLCRWGSRCSPPNSHTSTQPTSPPIDHTSSLPSHAGKCALQPYPLPHRTPPLHPCISPPHYLCVCLPPYSIFYNIINDVKMDHMDDGTICHLLLYTPP